MTLGLKKWILVMLFREKYPAAEALIGSNDIIFVYSRHFETVILMTRCGSEQNQGNNQAKKSPIVALIFRGGNMDDVG